MTLSNAIKLRIKRLLKKNNMSIGKLATASGITKSTLYTFMQTPNALPNIITLQHICEGFNISLRDFFDDTMFEETEQD